MNDMMIGAKIKAAAIHGLVTAVTALLTAGIVFWIWYPGPFAEMLSGTDLFLIVLAVELCLGPMMSLVIYSPKKPRSELVRDYIFIAIIQCSALGYGLYSVALSRPVYLAFVKDRIEIVVATELDSEDIAAAKDTLFGDLPWLGPRAVCTQSPSDPQKKSDLIISALGGKDIQMFPIYYRECMEGEIIGRAYTKEKLFSLTQITRDQLPEYLLEVEFKWLPVVTRFGSWIVVYANNKIESPVYLKLNPFSEE